VVIAGREALQVVRTFNEAFMCRVFLWMSQLLTSHKECPPSLLRHETVLARLLGRLLPGRLFL
jgi:hypothetical protein